MRKSAPAHWKIKDVEVEDETTKEMHADYCFLIQEDEDGTITVLVVRFRRQKLTFAHVVPVKGADIESAAKRLIEDVKASGIKRVVMKSDQEPAILALKD